MCGDCLTVTPGPTKPSPTSADPNSLPAGTVDAAVTLSGSGFVSGAKVTSHSGIKVKTTFVSSSQLDLTVTIAGDETPASYNLYVTNPDDEVGTCEDCLAVMTSS